MKSFIPIKIESLLYGYISASLSRYDKSTVLLLFSLTKKLKCIVEGSVYFILEDETRSKGNSWLEYNCDGNFGLSIEENKNLQFTVTGSRVYANDDLSVLINKKVSSIRLDCKAGRLDFDLTTAQSQQLKNSIKALLLQGN